MPEKCTSCGNLIAPYEDAVHFPCPSCGDVLLWRCEACRRFARAYHCPKCNFEGP
ncbi:zinc finger domain-containing protein [Promethearchaeum syntrophicum]|uniref:Zinc finger domain-containing protein n=1 Tax=Promethearchaeum syntrophicum TaxID=2594042 RepID=A0AC61ZU58_9ARCH|nr:zinc finger domain-containing protein [Candidatus Prometheoarchaeum syntrophicum]